MNSEVIVISGGILGCLSAWGFRLYIRHGQYSKVPVIDGENSGWFEVPCWLRWSVLASYGFVVASVFLYVLMQFNAIQPSTLMSSVTGPMSLVLALALFLADRSPTAKSSKARRRIVYGVAVGLGMALAMLIYGVMLQSP